MTEKTYPIVPEIAESAHIDESQYRAMYERSLNDPDAFWAEQADEFVTDHQSDGTYGTPADEELPKSQLDRAGGSISKAADKLFLSQPSVSLQIQALERELDAQLFDDAL